jgi:hypothetical protein
MLERSSSNDEGDDCDHDDNVDNELTNIDDNHEQNDMDVDIDVLNENQSDIPMEEEEEEAHENVNDDYADNEVQEVQTRPAIPHRRMVTRSQDRKGESLLSTVKDPFSDDDNIELQGWDQICLDSIESSRYEKLVHIDRWKNDLRSYLTTIVPDSVTKLSLPSTPSSVKQAVCCPDSDKWIEAICKEMKQIEDMGVLAKADKRGRSLKSKIVLRVTYDNNFNLKYKARFVILGCLQKYGVDYKETYAPTTFCTTIFLMLNLAACNGFY